MSQPWISNLSLVHWMPFASPHPGFKSLLRDVICFHWPIAPAQTSGGALKESRITAACVPSAETERLGPHKPALMLSAPRHRFETAGLSGSTREMEESASRISANKILLSVVQVSQLAEDFLPGVMSLAFPPAHGMMKMSPPTLGSSLMRPSMKAICFPSGDHAGRAIWSCGL